ncbi:MAG: selenoprotein B glycine/betaine/sarcosine/D-proline reductase [Candidatus Latescibacteria bacterium]|nr:selenoprotein B glycine/betaine/sarcosine/D-proline reductase [Candidatus Latescibacterota bacterium]
MVRLTDLPEIEREHLLAKPCPAFARTPWVQPPSLQRMRLAVITTAGLSRRGDQPFALYGSEYRVIPGDTDGADLVMSHSSVNFDRSGFQQDLNVVFPIDRCRELVAEGKLGSTADYHYAFMGAALNPADYESSARQVARLLQRDQVDAVLLCPV